MGCLLYARHHTKHFQGPYFVQLPQHGTECKHLEGALYETDTIVVSFIIPFPDEETEAQRCEMTCTCFFMTKPGLTPRVCVFSNLRIEATENTHFSNTPQCQILS